MIPIGQYVGLWGTGRRMFMLWVDSSVSWQYWNINWMAIYVSLVIAQNFYSLSLVVPSVSKYLVCFFWFSSWAMDYNGRCKCPFSCAARSGTNLQCLESATDTPWGHPLLLHIITPRSVTIRRDRCQFERILLFVIGYTIFVYVIFQSESKNPWPFSFAVVGADASTPTSVSN
jgi:hypothetical protein